MKTFKEFNDINENKFYIDKDQPDETIVVEVNRGGFVTLYQSHHLSGESRRFVIDTRQLPELIKILSKIK